MTRVSTTLFLIFVNDLLDLPFHGKICAFADDIVLLFFICVNNIKINILVFTSETK